MDQQDGGPGSHAENDTGGAVDDAASGGVSNDRDVHGEPDQVT